MPFNFFVRQGNIFSAGYIKERLNVFEEDYELPDLEDIQKYIKDAQHALCQGSKDQWCGTGRDGQIPLVED